MNLTDAQLGRLVAQALPGARLHEAEPLGERTLLLHLDESRRAVLRLGAPPDPGAGDPLAAELAALRALRAEIDLPLPEVLAHDLRGEAGNPYLLLAYLEGTPLIEVLGALDEEQRYAVGQALGALLARVHQYTAPAYGTLDPDAPPGYGSERGPTPGVRADEDVAYYQQRLAAALAAARAAGELDARGAAALAAWAATNVVTTGQPACLTHGDLRPARVLVRRRDRHWRLAGLTGWGYALAWRPAWDHVAAMEHFAGQEHFSIRVGYGNAYDATTERRYDQVREFALTPYRLVLFLEAGRPDLALALLQHPEQL
ncbi:MAG: phosphotransferase family protein [Chloroflexaceae bacterium]